jgi:hypothetical protein
MVYSKLNLQVWGVLIIVLKDYHKITNRFKETLYFQNFLIIFTNRLHEKYIVTNSVTIVISFQEIFKEFLKQIFFIMNDWTKDFEFLK